MERTPYVAEALEIPEPAHGHRKISAALATFAAGDTVGKDTLVWLWGLLDRLLQAMTDAPDILGPMPETVALELVVLATFLAFYKTKEEPVFKRLSPAPANPPNQGSSGKPRPPASGRGGPKPSNE